MIVLMFLLLWVGVISMMNLGLFIIRNLLLNLFRIRFFFLNRLVFLVLVVVVY